MQFKSPFTACLSAGTKCGKTNWAVDFVNNAKSLIEPPPEKIYWAYGEWQDGYKDLPSDVILIEGVPDTYVFKADKTIPKLLICDDLMRNYKKDDLCELFCQGSHVFEVDSECNRQRAESFGITGIIMQNDF